MEFHAAALLSVGFLLLLTGGSLSDGGPLYLPIRLTVELNNTKKFYSTSVKNGGLLIGGMRRLKENQKDFTFTVTEDPDYGLFLLCVNEVCGNSQDHTYWELLSESSGEYTPLNVGVGCYMPKENEHIVFRFRTWSE